MRKLVLLLGVALLCMQLSAQQRTVTGKVTDEKGNPIPNASILVKGTQSGSVSQSDGSFTMKITKGAALQISSLGFETKTVPISDNIDISLKADPNALSEVVVTGLGVATSKKKVGISVETVTADKLPPVPSASLAQALAGKIAGAQISSSDGTPGAKMNILLRGINTVKYGTSPMILVDGIQVASTDIGALDLNSVERVEVVEGAASSTLYGAQGANGVVQIFTKKGKANQMTIDFSSSYGSSTYLNNGNVAQAATHAYKTDASGNIVDASGVVINVRPDGTFTSGVNIDGKTQGSLVWANTSPSTNANKPYTGNFQFYDHFKQVFSSAANLNTSLAITGGSNKSDYALIVSNSYQESVFKDNGALRRTNLTSNIGVELFKGFKIRSITQVIYKKNDFNPYFKDGPNILYQITNSSPFFNFDWKDANGDYAYRLNASPVSVNGANPNYYKEYAFGTDQTVSVLQNIQASYRVNKFFDVDFKYGINYEKQDINNVYKNQTLNLNVISTGSFIGVGTTAKGGISNTTNSTTFQNALTTANLHFDLQKDFGFKLPITSTTLAGYDYRKKVDKAYTSTGDGLPLYEIYNMRQTSSQQVTVDRVTPFITFGTFVNEAIDYGTIAGVRAGFRSDYSSAFGGGSTSQTFYNGNGWLRISQMPFWDRLSDFIPEFKIRGGYGEAGIQPGAFDRYPIFNTSNVGTNLAFSIPAVQPNPALVVEVSKESEIGTDIVFKAGKGNWLNNIALSGTLWKRKSVEGIFQIDAPPSNGSNSLNNTLALSSKGYTFSLNTTVVTTKDFNWDMTVNFNHQSSQIDNIAVGGSIIVLSGAGYGNYVLQAGSKIGQIYGLKTFHDVNQTKQDGTPYIAKADQGKYQVVNGNLVDTATKGILFTNENYAFGDPNPKFNMAFINTFSYKFLTFSFQLDWIHGSHLYNQTKEWMYRDGIHADWGVPVTVNGQTGAWANYYTSAYADKFGSINGARNSIKDYFYEDASFLRLRNISLAVDVLKITKLRYFKRLQLVFSGRNIWTHTKYTGMDPEVSSGTNNSGFDRGVDYVSMPNNKTYQVGINVGF